MNGESPYRPPTELDAPEQFPRYSWRVRVAMGISVVLIVMFLAVLAVGLWEEFRPVEADIVTPPPPEQLELEELPTATSNSEAPDESVLISSQHPTSQRHATIEDDGTSAWLYLSEPESRKPVADAWVHNRIPAPPTSEIKNYRGSPPPAALGYASETAICASPTNHRWEFIWNPNGDAVAITRDGQPVAFTIADPRHSCSRELIKDGPWGHVWSQELFDQTFGTTAHE